MAQVPAWLRRLLALALLLAVLAATYQFAVSPLLAAYGETDTAIRETKQLLAGYQRVARTAPVLKRRLGELHQRQAESGVYLRGETDALAAAELQDEVKQTIESSGGQVRSIQTLPTETRSGFERVTVRVQYTGSVQTLLHVLYDLEAHRPLLFVDNLDIRGNIRRTRNRQPRDGPTQLIVRFDLSGYLRPDLG